jgi:formate dehydrogenase (coenzyme F420) beta subunit
MQELHKLVHELFENDKVKLLIGYRNGIGPAPRAAFITDPSRIEDLIFNQDCVQNLVTYIHKPEVKSFGNIGIIANIPALKTILQLASENQVKDGDLTIITATDDGKIIQFESLSEIEQFLEGKPLMVPAGMHSAVDKIMEMSFDERFKFWADELSNCIKCYACRAACPMCYCTKCTVEINQPQWIPIASHGQGNFEWQILRTMHLAGRCVACGDCARACPVDIPLGLLNLKMSEEIDEQFDSRAGYKADYEYPLSYFKNEDKEIFIK